MYGVSFSKPPYKVAELLINFSCLLDQKQRTLPNFFSIWRILINMDRTVCQDSVLSETSEYHGLWKDVRTTC